MRPLWSKKKRINRSGGSTRSLPPAIDSPELMPGDQVRVRSEKEIRATLDRNGKLKGLTVMPEMYELCNKEFRVYKRVNRMLLESTGEMRELKSPTYSLEGAYCSGSRHNGCDRSCFFLWKGEWLEKL